MAEEQPAPAAPAAEESSAFAKLPQFPNPQAQLAEKITKDWLWLSGLYASYSQSTALRESCTSTRVQVQSVADMCYGMQASFSSGVSSMNMIENPPSFLTYYKESALEFRRKYAPFIVVGLTGLSILPAISVLPFNAGLTKLDKLRMAARNFLCTGAATSVLLYPEFTGAYGIAGPALSRTAESVHLNGFAKLKP